MASMASMSKINVKIMASINNIINNGINNNAKWRMAQ
jgi:hypothetical protein